MRLRFFAHQLTQIEIVDPLPSDPKHTDFFCLTLLHLLDVHWQMQGKAGLSCIVFHANWLFLSPYLKMHSGLSYIFFLLEESELHSRSPPKAL